MSMVSHAVEHHVYPSRSRKRSHIRNLLSLFGSGMVEGTRTRSGMSCYAVTGAISGTTPLPNGQKMSRYCDEKSVVELRKEKLSWMHAGAVDKL